MSSFTIEEVAEALGRKRSDVDYIVYSYRLTLASDAPGQLNRRRFPIFDLYVLAVVFELVRLTGRREEVCRAVEKFLWWGPADDEDARRAHHGLPLLTASERMKMRDERRALCAQSPVANHEALAHRDLTRPKLLVGYEVDGKIALEVIDDDGLWVRGYLGIAALWVLNLSRLLADVDRDVALIKEAA